jgi:hypothetical protein
MCTLNPEHARHVRVPPLPPDQKKTHRLEPAFHPVGFFAFSARQHPCCRACNPEVISNADSGMKSMQLRGHLRDRLTLRCGNFANVLKRREKAKSLRAAHAECIAATAVLRPGPVHESGAHARDGASESRAPRHRDECLTMTVLQ